MTLQCVIIFTSASDVVTVQSTVWSRNGLSVINIPNHNQLLDPDTGVPSDLVIINVRLGDDNTVYTCTATGSSINSSVVLNVIGKLYLYLYVCTMQITLGQILSLTNFSKFNVSYTYVVF